MDAYRRFGSLQELIRAYQTREPEELHGFKFAGSSHFSCWQVSTGPQEKWHGRGRRPAKSPCQLTKTRFPAHVPQQEKLEVFVRVGCVAWNHIEPQSFPDARA